MHYTIFLHLDKEFCNITQTIFYALFNKSLFYVLFMKFAFKTLACVVAFPFFGCNTVVAILKKKILKIRKILFKLFSFFVAFFSLYKNLRKRV